ncbi:MAG: formate dehydrogenase accessory protein FdhE [Syntrophobacteraceae bacterium]
MDTAVNQEKDRIERAIALARVERPTYSGIYSFLEELFLARAEVRSDLRLDIPPISAELAATKWENGFPLLNRWDFPIDVRAAEHILDEIGRAVPVDNLQLAKAFLVLRSSVPEEFAEKARFWNSFLHHELEPWEEWVGGADTGGIDLASLMFLARSAAKPSLEQAAERLLEIHPAPTGWLRGYCPVCGSLPSLLYLEGEGERRAFCSWCATKWDLHRLQCPNCDNRYHESLGYLALEAEPQNRITYCTLCKCYFKQLDTRELAYPPYLPLEEWTTLHLDLLAQKEGWVQPPSPSPAVYGKST